MAYIKLEKPPEAGQKRPYKPQVLISDDKGPIGAIDCISGIKLIVDNDIPQGQKWVFPKDKYIEYGPEDEWWAIPWGFGHWQRKPVAYQVELNGEFVVVCNDIFKDLIRKYTHA